MFLPRLTNLALAVITVTAVGLSAAVPVASAAEPSAAPRVKVLSRAGVQADGAGVAVTVRLRCDSGLAYLNVGVTQSRGAETPVSGYSATTVPCTGATQKVPVAAAASTLVEEPYSSAPFTTGAAFVSVDLTVCDSDSTCSSDQSYRTVRLTHAVIENGSYESPNLTLSLPEQAEIEAAGAGVVVKVPYTCAPGVYAYAYGVLAQLTSPGVVSLSDDQVDLSCTSSNRTGLLIFHAQSASFVEGDAFVIVGADYCDDFDHCESPVVFTTVEVA